jgi:hypothetical protein
MCTFSLLVKAIDDLNILLHCWLQQQWTSRFCFGCRLREMQASPYDLRLQVASLQTDARPRRATGRGAKDWASNRHAASPLAGLKDNTRASAWVAPGTQTEECLASSSTAGNQKEDAGAVNGPDQNRCVSKEVCNEHVQSKPRVSCVQGWKQGMHHVIRLPNAWHSRRR